MSRPEAPFYRMVRAVEREMEAEQRRLVDIVAAYGRTDRRVIRALLDVQRRRRPANPS